MCCACLFKAQSTPEPLSFLREMRSSLCPSHLHPTHAASADSAPFSVHHSFGCTAETPFMHIGGQKRPVLAQPFLPAQSRSVSAAPLCVADHSALHIAHPLSPPSPIDLSASGLSASLSLSGIDHSDRSIDKVLGRDASRSCFPSLRWMSSVLMRCSFLLVAVCNVPLSECICKSSLPILALPRTCMCCSSRTLH